MVALAECYGRVRAGLAARERDPLTYWRHSSTQSLEATRLLADFDELYARAANKGGKTEWMFAAGLAMLQKRRTLDGVPLPQWRGKLDGICLVLDYKQQKLSVQQTVLRLLGQNVYKPHWKGDRVLSSLLIQPREGPAAESSDVGTWSSLEFLSQENMSAGVGARADLVLGDEPPKEPIWRETRKAAHAGRRIVRMMAVTPLLRRQWEWLKRDYGDPGRGSITRHADWAEVRWSVFDNKALPDADVEKLLREYAHDPWRLARIYGDYFDASGDCPWDIGVLNAMEAEWCKADPEIYDWRIQREVPGEQGLVRRWATAEVHVYEHYTPGRLCYVNVDPSRGIQSPNHDPGAVLVLEQGTGNLLAEYNGYLGAFGLGVLAAALARQYGDATVDPESNSGWGEGVLRGLAEAGYGNVSHTRKMAQPGRFEVDLGFLTSHTTRGAMIEAIQAWIDAYRGGIPYARCPSRRVLQALRDCVLDDLGRVAAAPGTHDEFVILWGQGLRKTQRVRADANLARPVRPPPRRRIPAPAEVTVEQLLKEAVAGDRGEMPGGVIPSPRRRPRGR